LMLAGDAREMSGTLLPPAEGAPEPRAVRLVRPTQSEPPVPEPDTPEEEANPSPAAIESAAAAPVEPEPAPVPLPVPVPVPVREAPPEGRSRGSYIIGNRVGRTIVAMDGHTIATEGEVITSEIVEDAKASGRITDLIVDMVVRDRFQGV
jgi:hypothetical protein